MGSSLGCPSGELGLCDLYKSKCYAHKAEKLYPQVKPFRELQSEIWLNNDAFTIFEALYFTIQKNHISRAKNKIKYIRFNESGDFYTKNCLNKLIQIANLFENSDLNIKIYTYTHRSDLLDDNTYKIIPKNLTINTSNFERKNMNSFNVSNKLAKKLNCIMDCNKCSLCKVTHGKKITVLSH